jgi:hypothetical protein
MKGALRTFLKAGMLGGGLPVSTLTLQPDETAAIDTFVQEAAPTNAAATSATVATNGAAGSRRNAFLKFDLSTLAGKRILTATLYLRNVTTSGSSLSFPLHAILAANSAWVEGATWDYAVPSTVRWAGDTGADGGTDGGCSVSGTDYNATQIGSMEYTANAVADTEHAIALDVAQFTAMVAANYGMLMRRTVSGIFSLHSSSATTADFRPKLVVTYTG